MNTCKFCHREQERPLSLGYCVSCYQYFITHGYETWYPSKFGELARVENKESKQYSWPICHICGRAYSKLQQHIYYSHDMSKAEYCAKFGIDKNINMTSYAYNEKMREYAYENNMHIRLQAAGVNTRFEKGRNNNYKRSPMTQVRLKQIGSITIHRNRNSNYLKLMERYQKALDYINSFDDVIKKQFIKTLNGPVEELGADQLRLKCDLLGYDLNKDIKLD